MSEEIASRQTEPESPTEDKGIDKSISADNVSKIKDFEPLYQFFDVGNPNPRLDEIMSKIWDWAKSQTSDSKKDNVIYEVIRLKHRLGEPSMGERPWAKLLNYITIQNRVKEDELRLDELERK